MINEYTIEELSPAEVAHMQADYDRWTNTPTPTPWYVREAQFAFHHTTTSTLGTLTHIPF